jgi:hypothetical protein
MLSASEAPVEQNRRLLIEPKPNITGSQGPVGALDLEAGGNRARALVTFASVV